jgi:prephenate dehydrogenase
MLHAHFPVVVHDPSTTAQARALAQRLRVADLPVVASCDVVLLAVPVSALEAALRLVAPHLTPGALVLDLASIKENPARFMDELLPAHVRIVATHPMFGPRSASDRASPLTVVVCPVRHRAWRRVAAFLRKHGLRVIVASPEEHDRQAALTQGLTHLLANALSAFDHRVPIRTRSFDLLMSALAMVRDESPEAYEAVTRTNRHVAGVRDGLIRRPR